MNTRDVQAALVALGHSLTVVGVAGPQTAKALQKAFAEFQEPGQPRTGGTPAGWLPAARMDGRQSSSFRARPEPFSYPHRGRRDIGPRCTFDQFERDTSKG
jgi:peptidoglycan hydrolase-like protein with peptidoglycan-binding domain